MTVKKIFGIPLLNNLFISYLNLFLFLTELKTFLYLTHFSPVSHFYSPWKRQKTFGFLTFSGAIEMTYLFFLTYLFPFLN